MANDGQIVFEVTADGRHAIADIKEITKAIQQETGKWDDSAKQSTDNISNNFSGMLKKIVAGFSAVKIGKALLDIGRDAISAASDLEEVQNVVDVTFGANSNKIEAWAKAAGAQFGLTETQAKRFTSTLGAMMKSAGMSGEKIADVSTDLAGLAADMASFYNLDFETAFQKIRSGLSGETEPLKQLGINMSVANLNAFALQQGLSKTFDQMSQGEQTMLRYQYLMQATSDAQGDFSRTSDGYANSVRKMQTNLDQLKTTLGKGLIDAVTEATGFLNSMLESLAPDESKRTVLDDIADIDLKTEAKITDIQKTADEARLLIDELDKIGGANSDGFTDLEGRTGGLEGVIESLGDKTSRTAEEQALWLETCKRLVKTIPGLSSIINTETGEIKGGTSAVKDYVKAWEEGQTKLALLGALGQKENAISERFADLPGLQLDAALAERRVREQRKKMDELRKRYGFTQADNQRIIQRVDESDNLIAFTDAENEWNAAVMTLASLEAEARSTGEAYQTQADALEEAKLALEEYRATIDEMPGNVEQAASASEQFWIDNADNIKTVVAAADDALKKVSDYAQGVHDSVASAVDSTVKGFDFIGNAAQRQEKRLKPLNTELETLTKEGKDLSDINERISNAQDMYGIGNLRKNLESQLSFLREYKADMEAAREKGFSDEFLAQFADGSVESAEWLHEISNASDSQVTELNNLYGQVTEGKKELTDTLTQQSLSVDKTYETLAEKAKAAVAALDMQGEAAENTGKTVAGMAQGIADHVPDVATQVDAIIAELDRLNGYGINIDLGGFGSINFTTSTGKTEGSGRMGIPFIPHDDYIARLHEGERVLTAQENQIWNTLLNGGVAGFDLDDLGGVMRDNIKAGGNVYLDGRTVGAVISEQQGRSYKSLQRSGWQT